LMPSHSSHFTPLMRRFLLAVLPASVLAQQPVQQSAVKPGWQWSMDSVTTVGHLSQMQYGARVGLERIVRLLDSHRIPATFFIPSVSLAITPTMADVIKKSGRHEFGVHGWIHEMNMTLPDSAERALVTKALAELTQLTGTKPTGYRAPSWNFSPNTLTILRDLGFRYESSLMADDSPYELLQDGKPTGMVEIPVEWILDDAPLFDPRGERYASPRDVARVWMDE